MTMDDKIRQALLPFGDPVENAVNHQRKRRYYVFNYTTLGADFADDEPNHERYLIQVHLFAPLSEDLTERILQTKKALRDADFGWPSTVNASDETVRHIVFEVEAVMGVV